MGENRVSDTILSKFSLFTGLPYKEAVLYGQYHALLSLPPLFGTTLRFSVLTRSIKGLAGDMWPVNHWLE